MKKITTIEIGLVLLLSLYHFVNIAQTIAFKASYKLETKTTYHINSSYADSMMLYDKIKLLPLTVEDSYSEIYYDDATVEKVILHSYPFGLPEKWLKKPEKTVVTKDSAFSYVNGTVFTSVPVIKDSLSQLIDISEIAPYYLGTPEFNLPLTQEQVNLLEEAEINVITNDPITLFYEFGNKSIMFNSAFMVREISEYSGSTRVKSFLTAYKRNLNGRLVYDYTVHRTLNCEDEVMGCIEKVKVCTYTDLIREYIDPSLEPETIYVNDSLPFITASKLGSSNGVVINFSEDCPEQIIVNIRDLYGVLKENNIVVSKQNNIIYPQNLQLGLYVIEVLTPNVQSCTFMFTQ